MIRALLPICLTMSQALADESEETIKVNYWVLGSYAKADNAHAEMERLAITLDKPVEIRFDRNLAVFRVMTPATETSREDLGEQAAWLLPLEIRIGEATAASRNAEETPNEQAEADESLIIIEEPGEAPLFPEFAEDESLHQYCERLPDARLCQHPGIETVVEMDRVLAEQRDKLQGVCTEITHPKWLETCHSLYPED